MATCANCGEETDGEYVHDDCLPEYEAYLEAQAAQDRTAAAAARLQERGRTTARKHAQAIITRPARKEDR